MGMVPVETTAAANSSRIGRSRRVSLLARSGFKLNPVSLRGDFAGASIVAVISIAESIRYGLMVFGALGAAAGNRILTERPELAAELMANMAREIAARLRVTSEHLRSVS